MKTKSWNCHINYTNLSQLTLKAGDEFILSCQGSNYLNTKSIEFILSKEDKYKIKLLKILPENSNVDNSVNTFNKKYKIDFLVTTYRTGNHSLNEIYLSDGTKKVKINNLNFSVKSVLSIKNNSPYPPFSPYYLSLPTIYWIIFSSILFSIIFILFLKLKKIFKNKKLYKKALELQTSLSPINQFYKDLRTLNKKHSRPSIKKLEELEEIFYLFCSRFFLTIIKNKKELYKNLQKYNKKIYLKIKNDIFIFFNESKKIKNDKQISDNDLEQLQKFIITIADQIDEGIKNVGI